MLILLLLLKPNVKFCNRFNSSWFDWNKSVCIKWSELFIQLLLLLLLFVSLLLLLLLLIGTGFIDNGCIAENAFVLLKFWKCCKFWCCWFSPVNCWVNVLSCWLMVPKLLNCWFIVAMLLLFGVNKNDFRMGEPHSVWSAPNTPMGD